MSMRRVRVFNRQVRRGSPISDAVRDMWYVCTCRSEGSTSTALRIVRGIWGCRLVVFWPRCGRRMQLDSSRGKFYSCRHNFWELRVICRRVFFWNTETRRHWVFLRVRKIQRAAKATFTEDTEFSAAMQVPLGGLGGLLPQVYFEHRDT